MGRQMPRSSMVIWRKRTLREVSCTGGSLWNTCFVATWGVEEGLGYILNNINNENYNNYNKNTNNNKNERNQKGLDHSMWEVILIIIKIKTTTSTTMVIIITKTNAVATLISVLRPMRCSVQYSYALR